MFDPLKSARQVVAETNLTDPTDIADEVHRRTPEADLHDAYSRVLRATVREAIRTTNMDASRPAPQPQKSSRVAAIHARHVGYYDQRVCASGEWKMLRDCTRDDVLDLAAQRQAIAERNAAKAAEFERLHEQMASSGAQTVGDLERSAAA